MGVRTPVGAIWWRSAAALVILSCELAVCCVSQGIERLSCPLEACLLARFMEKFDSAAC